jgi:DsbC/DsbD-like thiol-disulfide interchange protein
MNKCGTFTRLRVLLSIAVLVLLALSGCARREQPVAPAAEVTEAKRIASVDVVKAEALPVQISAGESGDVTVRLTIQSGYHVNANPPTFSYLIPTELKIATADGITAGAISYPAPINAKVLFSEKPLAVYEGEIEVRATLKADKSAQPGQHSLPAKLRVQACDDQVCYPPGTRDLLIPVIVK